ncbi:MAG: RNA degradosome polyphosphate kinase, partial [Actinomycetales bacterium]
SLVDEILIDKLYEASQAGVPVDLIIRGICALKPGVPGLSENIRVRSILGRFLEHSRVYWFSGGGTPEAWLGSADLMHRNLDRRVEVLVKIPSPDHVESLGSLLETSADDGTNSWHLTADGEWERHKGGLDLQADLIARARQRRALRA